MQPRIQYATTEDGVSIAFWAVGDGPGLVLPPPAAPFSHCQMEARMPLWGDWYEQAASRYRLVRFDTRGTGLSDRSAPDLGFMSTVRDMEAVVAKAGLERFALYGSFWSGPASIAYAVARPEQVTRLILWATFATAAEVRRPGISYRDTDWEFFTESLAHWIFGWEEGTNARALAALMRESISPQTLLQVLEANEAIDVTALLAQIQMPTLVVHPRRFRSVQAETATRLAARIPDARLVVIDSEGPAPFLGDTDAAWQAMTDFLAEESSPSATKAGAGPALRTIVFTDMESHTQMTNRLGDERAREVLRLHEQTTRKALQEHGGAEVKAMGDGFMAWFPSASSALQCAAALQRAFEELSQAAPEPVRIRVGVNAGEPIAEEDDLFGTAVILAARIASQAKGGEILVSNVVRELTAGKGFLFADRGETALRGFEDPVRLFELRWREQK